MYQEKAHDASFGQLIVAGSRASLGSGLAVVGSPCHEGSANDTPSYLFFKGKRT